MVLVTKVYLPGSRGIQLPAPLSHVVINAVRRRVVLLVHHGDTAVVPVAPFALSVLRGCAGAGAALLVSMARVDGWREGGREGGRCLGVTGARPDAAAAIIEIALVASVWVVGDANVAGSTGLAAGSMIVGGVVCLKCG